jgi:hypothetical protein
MIQPGSISQARECDNADSFSGLLRTKPNKIIPGNRQCSKKSKSPEALI